MSTKPEAVESLIFVCHSSKDREAADELVQALERGGAKCWIGPRDVAVGDDYARAITSALQAATALTVVYSRHSAKSHDCLAELELAFRRKIPVFPWRIDPTPIVPEYEYRLARAQWTTVAAAGTAAAQILGAIRDGGSRTSVLDLSDDAQPVSALLGATLDHIEVLAEIHDAGPAEALGPRLTTGIPDLDALLGGGLPQGELTVLGGRGASLLALSVAGRLAVFGDIATLVHCPGGDHVELNLRFLSGLGRVPIGRMISGRMTEDDWNKLARIIKPVSRSPLLISTPRAPSIADIVRDVASNPDLKCVVIPAMASGQDDTTGNPTLGGPISTKNLRDLAAAHGVAVLLVSAVANPDELREEGVLYPEWVDGGINARVADNVLLLDWSEDNSVRLVVLKARQGTVGEVNLRFQPEYGQFTDDVGIATTAGQLDESWAEFRAEFERMGETEPEPPEAIGAAEVDHVGGDEHPVEPVSLGQALGAVEHILGARVIADEV